MTNLEKQKEAASKAKPAAVASTGLKSEGIFSMMKSYLALGEGKALIPKVSAIFCFEITKAKGQKPTLIYEIDLKTG